MTETLHYCLSHASELQRIARAILRRDPSRAEDAVQETYATVLASDTEPENVPGWVRTIVRRHAISILRRERVRAAEPLDSLDVPESDYCDHSAELRAAVEQLPDAQRDTIRRSLDGQTYAEIAAQTVTPIGTVCARAAGAKKNLREILSAGQ